MNNFYVKIKTGSCVYKHKSNYKAGFPIVHVVNKTNLCKIF